MNVAKMNAKNHAKMNVMTAYKVTAYVADYHNGEFGLKAALLLTNNHPRLRIVSSLLVA